MDLDFDKYCLVDGSPTTVLPAPRLCSEVANKKLSGKPKYINDVPSINEEDFEIDFGYYSSAWCRDVQSREVGDEVLKRGSVYQSSKEVRLLQETDAVVGRKKIEFSPGIGAASSFGIIDSLCSSDEDSSLVGENRSSVMSLSKQSTSVSMITNSPREKDLSVKVQKSISPISALPHYPAEMECDGSRASNPKARFTPVKKMFEPFVKSKSHISPLSSFTESGYKTRSGSFMNDILEKPLPVEHNHQCQEKENRNSVPRCSPAHLHGLLKSGNKHGVPFFQFSVKSPEDVYVAKMWRVDNASTWVYTFHLLPHRRKRNTSGWGFKESNRVSSMVGQMHVSCHLCTEFKDGGELNDSMVTEFVLYDIIHSRKSTVSLDNSIRAPLASDDVSYRGNCESSASQPLGAAKLHPELEIAAIIMQVPLENRESLKFKKTDERSPNLLDPCLLGKAKEGNSDISSLGLMHVVIPTGNHSLPVTESRGPSRLLDRWKLGGGCDCGGWDMACPLNIFSNQTVRSSAGQPLIDNQNPAELFVQGRKDKIPAFTMRMIEDGKYGVEFHAQLSSLQAFSICIAILHTTEASTFVGHERSKQTRQSDSMRLFAEEEIKIMLDAITEEDKSKVDKMEEVLPSLRPPFSPVARV